MQPKGGRLKVETRRPITRIVGWCSALAISVGLVLLLRTGSQPKGLTDADIAALAENAHIIVGDVPLVLPFVAMPDQVSLEAFFSLDRSAARKAWKERRDAFRKAALSAANPLPLDRVTLQIETYGWNDADWDGWLKICPKLSAQWAQAVCDNPWSPILQALPPNRFHLADRRKLDVFMDAGTVGGENVYDQLQSVSLETGEASIECDPKVAGETQFCTAAVTISKDLIGVWSVWESEKESAAKQAEREGRAIVAFIKFALGYTEEFDALLAVACTTRRPGSELISRPSKLSDPCIK